MPLALSCFRSQQKLSQPAVLSQAQSLLNLYSVWMSFWQNNAPRSPAPHPGWKPTARKIPLGSAMTQAFMENLQLEGALLPELVFTRPIAQEQLDPQELKRFIESALAELALPLPRHLPPEEAGRKTELAGNLVNCVLMGSGKLRLPHPVKRFRIQERPRLFAALSDQIQRGSFSKSARSWWPQQPSRPWRTSASGAEQAGAGRQPGPGGVSC